MKTLSYCLLVPWVILTPLSAQVVVVEHHSFTSGQSPTDGNASGVSDTRVIVSAIAQLTDVNVSLSLTNPFAGGAHNGDYLVYLTHETGFAVLLNRVGKRDPMGEMDFEAAFGYADNGFDITLDDQAENGDVHVYRLQLGLGGSHGTPVDADYIQPLRGAWAPDGRHPDDGNVITAPRSALLSSFNGLPASGAWTLFVADLSRDGMATLDHWSLELTGTPVPEPEAVAGVVGLGLLLWGWCRRTRNAG